MHSIDIHPCVFYNSESVGNLVNGNPKFGINVANGNITVTACHDMWINSYAYRNFGMAIAKFFQGR